MSDTSEVNDAANPLKGEDLVTAMKGIVDGIRTEAADEVLENRKDYEDVLFCRWDGQSSDGRKWQDNYKKKVTPFEGASDNRVRLADMLVSERVKLMVAAAMRADPKFGAMDGADQATAAKWGTLAKWLRNNYWGADFRKALKLVARWQESDTPAVSAMLVDWYEEWRLEYQTVDGPGLVDLYLERAIEQGIEPDTVDAEQILEMARNPALQDELVAFLKVITPGVSDKTVKRVARELQTKGESEFPAPYKVKDGPMVRPLRVFEDVFVPANTTDPNKSRVVLLRYWFTETEIKERQLTEGWSEQFVDKLLGTTDHGPRTTDKTRGFETRSGFDTDAESKRVVTLTGELNARQGLWEVIKALHFASNEDGVPGIYETTFSYFVDVPALAMRPFKRKHGKMPLVWFQREQLTSRFLDSRGVPELAMSDQASLKLLKDSREDHTQVSTLPPIKRPPNKPHYVIEYAPMGEIESNSREPTEFMTPPMYPASNDKYKEEIRRDLAEFWGRAHPEVNEMLVQLCQQDFVDSFLDGVAGIYAMAIQLCQEFMPDEMIARVVGGNGLPVARSRKEIQGQFDMSMAYDVRDMDGTKLKEKAELVLNYVKALDVRSRVQYDDIAAEVLAAIDPVWAERFVRTADQADTREVEEEKAAFVMCVNGSRAPMPEGGINAPLRLQVLQGEIQKRQANPAAYPPIPAAGAALLQERMDYLEFQGKQMQNAVTGRIGVDVEKTDAAIAEAGASAIGPQTTDYGLQTTDNGPRTTDNGLRTTDNGLRTTDNGLQTMRGMM